LTGIFIDNS